MSKTVVADFSNFVNGTSITIIENGQVVETKQVPTVDGPALAALASENGIDSIILSGPDKFVKRIKQDMSINFSNINITIM